MRIRVSSAVSPSALGALIIVGLCWPATVVAVPPDDQTAEPVPAPAPGLIPPLADIGGVLAQAGAPATGPLGLPDLSAYAPALLLAQNQMPVTPGDPAVPQLPSLSAFNPDYLIGQNLAPAAPGQGTVAPGLGPTAEDPGTGRLSFLRRLYEMYGNGQLDGALLGQQPAGEPPN